MKVLESTFMPNIENTLKKGNDERGTRTPGMQGITGLAIPRHTGLGYLVTADFKKRVPLNAFHVFNPFRGAFHINCFAQGIIMIFIKLRLRKVLSDEHASGRCIAEIPVDWPLFSTPRPRKRQLPTVSLLPSGPRPVSAVRV